MEKLVLFQEITKYLDVGDCVRVIELWEKYGHYELDLIEMNDREICDAISISYLKINNYDKSLNFINQRISFMKSKLGYHDRTANDYSNWDHYCGMKRLICYKRELFYSAYKNLLEYRKLGGSNKVEIEEIKDMENLVFQKMVKKSLHAFVYFLSVLIPFMIIFALLFNNHITSSFFYYAFGAIGGSIIILYLYFESALKDFIMRVMKLLIRLG